MSLVLQAHRITVHAMLLRAPVHPLPQSQVCTLQAYTGTAVVSAHT